MLSEAHEYNEYWRLSEWNSTKEDALLASLQNLGRDMTRYYLKGDLVDKQNLNDRGLLPYESESITIDELQHFVRDRGLWDAVQVRLTGFALPATAAVTRFSYVAALKEADENQTFSKFVDLSPELRERIYKLYMAEFPSKLTFPTKPPLTLTCRLLRKEALPLFYQSTTFNLYFSYEPSHGPNKNAGLKPCLETTVFLKSLGISLRNVEFHIGCYPKYFWNGKRETIHPVAVCGISVGSLKAECSVKVKVSGQHLFYVNSKRVNAVGKKKKLQVDLEKRLTRAVKRIFEDGDGRKMMGAKEIGELQQAAHSAYHMCDCACFLLGMVLRLIDLGVVNATGR